MENYYEILGIERGATKDEIKKAFRKLAHQYHPDKKGGDEAKFKKVNEAYQILSDEKKRAQYDQFGQAGANGGPGGFDYSGFAGGQGFDFSEMFRQAGFGGGDGQSADFSDIFEGIFGGGRGRAPRRGRDIAIDVQITFRESVFGVTRTMLLNKVGACNICSGKGAKPGSKMVTCKSCDGKGTIRESRRSLMGTFTTERECDQCAGKGQLPDEPCATCAGKGIVKQAEEIAVHIPAGIGDGEMIRMGGRGEAIPHGTPGDLYVKIHVERHPLFTRDGANLLMDLEIKFTDALLGAEYKIETLEAPLTLKVPAGISHGELLRVKGKGVPLDGSRRGDLLVRVILKTPSKLSKKAAKLVEELKEEGI
ncbi:MAG: molecular chaperone DnaJ [Patescibacteria group bacterium]